jgi:hypothetical protein
MFPRTTKAGISRRQCLRIGSCGFGSLALTALLSKRVVAGPLTPKSPHFAPRAKSVIFLFMNGGPSQMDCFDYKPELRAANGKQGENKQKLLAPMWDFSQHGESGLWFSELFPPLAKRADNLCMLLGMQTSSRAYPLAIPLLHTGSFQSVRPAMGSWALYGLGTENQNLPGFVTIKPTRTFGGPSNYGSAFLPSIFQGTRIGWESKPVNKAKIGNLVPRGFSAATSTRQLRLVQTINQKLLERTGSEPLLQGVVDSLDLSDRMQEAVPEVMDLRRETKETLALYGIGSDPTDDFGRQCLTARRLVERGIRFVELGHSGWDHHSKIDVNLPKRCRETDQPIAALLTDLLQRGLLDETLVVWSGEFGRQPETQILEGKATVGRDHNAEGYTAWLAGGGVRGGMAFGATDELGYKAVENKVHLHDLHATMLYLLGLDHLRLTYRYAGRDFRLTDIHGNVVGDILA